MAAPIPLRSDFDADMLRGAARGSRDAAQARRLLALATILLASRQTPCPGFPQKSGLSGKSLKLLKHTRKT